MAKGYTQKEGFDNEETFSPVAMIKSIRILLSIASHKDYKIWQMNVKTTFLNRSLEETIYMIQPEGFIIKSQEKKVCKLQKFIYGLKQASRSWNIRFDTSVYKRCSENMIVFLILYVDDIFIIGNDLSK